VHSKKTHLPYETRRGHTHTRAETAPHSLAPPPLGERATHRTKSSISSRCSLGTAPSRVALFIMIAFQIRCCPKKFGKNNDAIALCFLLSLYVGTVALVSTDFLLFYHIICLMGRQLVSKLTCNTHFHCQ
jgi:hypothetical protein